MRLTLIIIKMNKLTPPYQPFFKLLINARAPPTSSGGVESYEVDTILLIALLITVDGSKKLGTQ